LSSGVYIPQDFVESLRTHVPKFQDESDRNQWGLALMAWEKSQKRRQHRTQPGAVSFSAKELEVLFGRNKYAPLLRTTFGNWSANWSQAEGTTRAYRFSIEVREALTAYATAPTAGLVDLLVLKGKSLSVAKSLPRAISSTGTNGKTTPTAQWSCAKHMNKVPVNAEMLAALQQWFTDQLASSEIEGPMRLFLKRLLDVVVKVTRLSQTTLAGPGYIPQVYAIAPTGRLYARGLNLQNTPSLIKEAALHGLWEYDFANCHFSIVSQMASERGVPCPAIDHYMANKKQVRQDIADGAGVTIDQAKQCLLALLYGAKESSWFKSAIPDAIGEEAAQRLYALPTFKALSADLDGARRAILDSWPRTANGSLTNACGKAIAGNATPARQLAHLVQGVEARALWAAVNLHPDDIVLLQHDGFVSLRRLDCAALEHAVTTAVGYGLRLEEEQIELHADARSLADRTKNEMALETASGLESGPPDAD